MSKTIIGKKGLEAAINALNSKNWLNYEHLLFLKNTDIETVLNTFRVNNVFYHKNCFAKVVVTRPRSSNLLEQKNCLTDGIVLHAIGFIKSKYANTGNCIFLHDLMHELVITSMSELLLCNKLKSSPLMDDYIVSYGAPSFVLHHQKLRNMVLRSHEPVIAQIRSDMYNNNKRLFDGNFSTCPTSPPSLKELLKSILRRDDATVCCIADIVHFNHKQSNVKQVYIMHFFSNHAFGVLCSIT